MSVNPDNVFLKYAEWSAEWSWNPNKNPSLGMGLQQGINTALQTLFQNPYAQFAQATIKHLNKPSTANVGVKGHFQPQNFYSI